MINMTNRTVLDIFKSLVEVRPKDKKIAARICNLVKIPFAEKDFIEMHIIERENDITDSPVNSIIITFKNREIEITILDELYFVTTSHNNNEYQFIKEYIYGEEEPLSESFALDNGHCMISIRDEYPSQALIMENDNISISRIHTENNYIDYKKMQGISIINFTDEIKTNNFERHQEVFYFQDENAMYHTNLTIKQEEFSMMAGASLSYPRYKLLTEDLSSEWRQLFKNIGIDKNTQVKHPKIYFTCNYIEDNYINRLEIHIIKDSNGFLLRIVKNKDAKTYRIKGDNTPNITINDLKMLKRFLANQLKEEAYIDLLANYLDELILRASMRHSTDFENINSYNKDIFDFYINEGKSIYGSSIKSIEQRAFDIYLRKENLNTLLENISIPDLSIKEHSSIKQKTT